MPAGLPVGTPRITTGNVRTTYDPYTPSPGATTPGPTPAPFNGLACPLGSIYMDQGGSDSVSGTLTQLPQGTIAVYKYLLYKSATNPALVAGPAPVYYTDNTGLVISGSSTDAFPATATPAGALAGIMMPNTGDVTTLTAAILNNGANGSGVWVCIAGFVKAVWDAGGVGVAGLGLIGATTNFTLAAAGASTFAGTAIYAMMALTTASSNKTDVRIYGLPRI